jgi:Zn-dependent protease
MAFIAGGDEGIRLFRLFGIRVSLHWTWFLVAAWQIDQRKGVYPNAAWVAGEYLALFGIVLLHEFGHALACRQVGGVADRILLWPLGGVAYAAPPARPGAYLWTIAAGPLVNVVLVPVFFLCGFLLGDASPEAARFWGRLQVINLVLLVFNMLPIYPLDGGQVLRGLLWFVMGPVRSLWAASGIGLLAGAGVVIWAVARGWLWMAVMLGFMVVQAWQGFAAAREAMAREREFEPPRP